MNMPADATDRFPPRQIRGCHYITFPFLNTGLKNPGPQKHSK
jgi:hypothetical protein